jgi:hypothetical protein
MRKVNSTVAEVGRKMQKKYGHIQCEEVQFHNWGKSFRFTNQKLNRNSSTTASYGLLAKK